MTVKIIRNNTGVAPGKLAEAELHFTDGPLAGLKLVGFGIWERRRRSEDEVGRLDHYNVTFPARQFTVNGERRSFALLRPVIDSVAVDQLRDVILTAYADQEDAEVGR